MLEAIQAKLKAKWCTTTITWSWKSCQITMIVDGELVAELNDEQIVSFFTEWQDSEPSRCFSLHKEENCVVLWPRQTLNQLGAKSLLSLLLLLNCLSFHSLAVSNMVGHCDLILCPHSFL